MLAQVRAGLGWCCELGGEESHPEKPTESTKSEHNPNQGFSCSAGEHRWMFLPLGTLPWQPLPSPPGWDAALLPTPMGPAFPLCTETPCAGEGCWLHCARTGKLTNFLFPLQWTRGKREPACGLPPALPYLPAAHGELSRARGVEGELLHWAGAARVTPQGIWPVRLQWMGVLATPQRRQPAPAR